MSAFDISADANDGRLDGGLRQWMDLGAGKAYVEFYDSVRPTTPGDPTAGTVLATLHFAKPCASLISHQLVFTQDDPGADIIAVQGSASWARIYNGAGTWMADCDVTNAAGSGPLKISGTTGTLLYAGALVILASFILV